MDPATTRLMPAGARGSDYGDDGHRHRDRMDQGSDRSVGEQHHPGEPDQPERANLLKAFPLPTRGGLNQNFVSNPIERYNNHQGDLRIDRYFSQNDTVFFRFSTAQNNNVLPPLYPGVIDGSSGRESDHHPDPRRSGELDQGLVANHRERGALWVHRAGYGSPQSVRGRPQRSRPVRAAVYDSPGYGGLPYFLITGIGRSDRPSGTRRRRP